jgi:hypothetical protein
MIPLRSHCIDPDSGFATFIAKHPQPIRCSGAYWKHASSIPRMAGDRRGCHRVLHRSAVAIASRNSIGPEVTGGPWLRCFLSSLPGNGITALLCHPKSDCNPGRGQDRAYDAGPSCDHCPSQSGGLLSRFNSRLFDKPILDVAARNVSAPESGNGRTTARSMLHQLEPDALRSMLF